MVVIGYCNAFHGCAAQHRPRLAVLRRFTTFASEEELDRVLQVNPCAVGFAFYGLQQAAASAVIGES